MKQQLAAFATKIPTRAMDHKYIPFPMVLFHYMNIHRSRWLDNLIFDVGVYHVLYHPLFHDDDDAHDDDDEFVEIWMWWQNHDCRYVTMFLKIV